MKNFQRNLVGMCLMLTGAHASFGVEPPTANQAKARVQKSALQAGKLAAASDRYLDSLRGGFDAGQGLKVSFGIDRSVTINGDLVSRVSFNLPDVAKITADTAKAVSAALAEAGIVQNGAGNRVELSVNPPSPTIATGAKTSTDTATAASATQAANGNAQGGAGGHMNGGTNSPSTTRTDLANTAAATGNLQGAAGARADVAANLPLPGVMVIQNSLNNQTIKSLTTINTSVNSLGLFKAINFQNGLRDAQLGSLVGR